jgi:Phytanoyl-CoA dioxygenase (PhyH)
MAAIITKMDKISDLQIEQFRRDGYLIIESAFTKGVAKLCEDLVLKMLQIEQHVDTKVPFKARFVLNRRVDAVFDRMITPSLISGLDRLFGRSGWDSTHFQSHGDFFITFPGFMKRSRQSSLLVGRWHVDLGYRPAESHDLHDRNCAFVPAFMVTDSKQDGACTLVAAGSHRVVARLLGSLDEPVQRQDMVAFCEGYMARKDGQDSVVQLECEAGDVVVMHPLLMHAASANCRDSVRIMANTGVGGVGRRQIDADDSTRCLADEIIWNEIKSIRLKPADKRFLKTALHLNRFFWALRYRLHDRWKREAETRRDEAAATFDWRVLPYLLLKPFCALTTSAIVRFVR